MTPSKVAIVILGYNARKSLGPLLDRAIDSALGQSYGNVKVIFADNGSADDSAEYVSSKYGDKVRVVRLGRNYGFCLGNNLAVRHLSPDIKYILFMNPDAVLEERYVEKLVGIMERDESVGIAQGLQRSLGGSFSSLGGYVDSYGRAVEVDVSGLEGRLSGLDAVFEVAWASGSAMMVRRELFERLGGFSPELFMYHDEIDLCARALSLGYRTVVYPRAVYYHRRGTEGAPKRINWLSWYLANRNKWLTTVRYFPLKHVLRALLLYLPVEVLINVLKSVRKGERARARLQLRIVWHVARNLRREASFRRRWRPGLRGLEGFIMDVPSPLIGVDPRRALRKLLSHAHGAPRPKSGRAKASPGRA